MTSHASNRARVVPLRPAAGTPTPAPVTAPAPKEPLWRDVVGDVLRRERLTQERTLKDVAETARISMPYLSELERGRKEASSEVLAAAAAALGLRLADLLALAQGELDRLARLRRPGANAVSPQAEPVTSVTSAAPRAPVADLGARRTGAGRAARPGDVRLAA